jgi:sarcosine oxidase
MLQFDVVVCGLGVMGSAALYHLARRGVRTLGIERFAPGHDRGSSHGASRIIRLSYHEHPSYVPLLRRAYSLWRELQATSGEALLHITGIVEVGPADGMLVRGTLASARLHGLPHEVLDAARLTQRCAAFRVPEHFVGVFQPEGGFVAAERSVHAFVRLAQERGAQLRTGETVRSVEERSGCVRIVTDAGEIAAAAAIVSVGPWLPSLLPHAGLPLRVTREVMGWFVPSQSALFAADRFPVFLLESRHGMHYGFPLDAEGWVKVARHHHRNESVDPDGYDRFVSADDERLIRDALAAHLPAANGTLGKAQTCLYTTMPDGDFLIDRLPGSPHVIVASPCSGHGFKFAPVIGEILADLATGGQPAHDIARFRWRS